MYLLSTGRSYFSGMPPPNFSLITSSFKFMNSFGLSCSISKVIDVYYDFLDDTSYIVATACTLFDWLLLTVASDLCNNYDSVYSLLLLHFFNRVLCGLALGLK